MLEEVGGGEIFPALKVLCAEGGAEKATHIGKGKSDAKKVRLGQEVLKRKRISKRK